MGGGLLLGLLKGHPLNPEPWKLNLLTICVGVVRVSSENNVFLNHSRHALETEMQASSYLYIPTLFPRFQIWVPEGLFRAPNPKP